MIVIDPTNNNRLFCGADVGVFGAEDAALQVEVIEKVNVEVEACCRTTQACSNGQIPDASEGKCHDAGPACRENAASRYFLRRHAAAVGCLCRP
jgi:hypothetical protein